MSTCSLNTIGNYEKISENRQPLFRVTWIYLAEKSPHQSSAAVCGKRDSNFRPTIDMEDDGLWSMAVAFSQGWLAVFPVCTKLA